jgi:hypothetical protein
MIISSPCARDMRTHSSQTMQIAMPRWPYTLCRKCKRCGAGMNYLCIIGVYCSSHIGVPSYLKCVQFVTKQQRYRALEKRNVNFNVGNVLYQKTKWKSWTIFLLTDAGPVTMQIYTWNRLNQFWNYILYLLRLPTFSPTFHLKIIFVTKQLYPFWHETKHRLECLKNCKDSEKQTWQSYAVFKTYSFPTQCRDKAVLQMHGFWFEAIFWLF